MPFASRLSPLAIFAAFALVVASSASAKQFIADTSGYIVQTADDDWGKTSPYAGDNFPGGAPVKGKHYLVTNGKLAREPQSTPIVWTFAGDSLSVDGGATLCTKGPGSVATYNDLRLYDARITHGDARITMTIAGNMTIYGDTANPVQFLGSKDRYLVVSSKVTGASDACIVVGQNGSEAAQQNGEFYTVFSGDNSNYLGSWISRKGGTNGNGGWFNLVTSSANALGPTPRVTLAGGSLLGGGNSAKMNGGTLTLDGGGRIGVYRVGSGTAGLTITGGAEIKGTGTLLVRNPNVPSGTAFWGHVLLDDVTVSGIDGIQLDSGAMRLGSSYANPTTPVSVTQSVNLELANGASAGPVTLQRSAFLVLTDAAATLASLDVQTSGYIRKHLIGGVLSVTGDIANNTDGKKIRIDFSDTSVTRLSAAQSWRVLSAANLGAAITADDFEATADAASDIVKPYVLGGNFSVETDDGVNYLVYTLPKAVVWTSGDNKIITEGALWSDGKAAHGDAAYFVTSGKLARAADGKTCEVPASSSFTVLDGGEFALQGAVATVPDFRIDGGGILFTTRPLNSVLAGGTVTVSGSASKPALVTTDQDGQTTARTAEVRSNVEGGGSVRVTILPGKVGNDSLPKGIWRFTGDNSGFSGEWQLAHWDVRTSFKDAAAVGGASAIHFISNGVFCAESSYTVSTPVSVTTTGAVAGQDDKTNGGTFEVNGGETLTVAGVVSGAGILRKVGAGVLTLTAAETITGVVRVDAGTLRVDGSLPSCNVAAGGFLGGAGKVAAATLAVGGGLEAKTGAESPVEIGTLTASGAIKVNITDDAALGKGAIAKIAVAKIGALEGSLDLDNSAVYVDGELCKGLRLSLSDGLLRATRNGLTIIIR